MEFVSLPVVPQNAAVLRPCFSLLLSGSLSSQKALEVQRLLGFQLTHQALHGLGTKEQVCTSGNRRSVTCHTCTPSTDAQRPRLCSSLFSGQHAGLGPSLGFSYARSARAALGNAGKREGQHAFLSAWATGGRRSRRLSQSSWETTAKAYPSLLLL